LPVSIATNTPNPKGKSAKTHISENAHSQETAFPAFLPLNKLTKRLTPSHPHAAHTNHCAAFPWSVVFVLRLGNAETKVSKIENTKTSHKTPPFLKGFLMVLPPESPGQQGASLAGSFLFESKKA
jgi:hypothetical protein